MAKFYAPRRGDLGVACRPLQSIIQSRAAKPAATVWAVRTETRTSLEIPSMRLLRICTFVLFALVGPARTSIYATTFVKASYNVNAHVGRDGEFFSEGPAQDINLDNSTASVDLGASADFAGAIGAVAQVTARAAVGDLGIKVSGVAQVPPGFTGVGEAQASASGFASWIDTVTLNVGGLPAFSGVRVEFKVFIDSEISVAALGNGQSLVQFSLLDNGTYPSLGAAPYQPINLWGYGKAAPGVHEVKESPDTLTLIMDVQAVGVEFKLGYAMGLGGVADPDNSALAILDGLGSFDADVSGSLHWGGIVSMTGPFGIIPRDQWSITSESGFDYSKPFGVPEPSSIALVSVVPGLWFVWARRRGRRA